MIPRKSVPSNQDVQVALVLNKSGEDDPFNAWSLATGEVLSPDSGAVVWYLATGKQQSDTCFAHGGFFSPLTDITHDTKVSWTPPATARVNQQMMYDISLELLAASNPDMEVPLRFTLLLPPSVTYMNVSSISVPGAFLPSCTYYEATRLVECITPAQRPTAISHIILALKPTVAANLTLKAAVYSDFADTNYANNQVAHTITVSP